MVSMGIVKRHKVRHFWYFTHFIKNIGAILRFLFSSILKKRDYDYPKSIKNIEYKKKGLPILTLDQENQFKCTACGLCQTACPAGCIQVEGNYEVAKSRSAKLTSFELDTLRCIYCGICEQVCPIDAIRMGPEWQVPGINGASFVYNQDSLSSKDNLKYGVKSLTNSKV